MKDYVWVNDAMIIGILMLVVVGGIIAAKYFEKPKPIQRGATRI